ncbi:unnamed protein product [Rhizoctonia solani]|uniref:Malate dehydrogenase n=1 Tax=Rhizoctonia solani TaxID=456999 RepID=A0A8H3GN61_9AGAM|nr:unnamed protein product [Rhizoctonia solani]
MHLPGFVTIILSALTLALAVPTGKDHGCSVSHAKLDLPDTQAISIPDGVKPEYIVLAIGTQNYTCTNAGNYSTSGVLSILIDISCLHASNSTAFEDVQNSAYNLFLTSQNEMPTLNQIQGAIGYPPFILGDHYFTPRASTIAPEFDFRKSQEGNADAFVIGRQVGGIPSPEGSQNIDWLQLEATEGQLAKYIYRVDTRGGQPPESCSGEGQDRIVPYTAKYWFFD